MLDSRSAEKTLGARPFQPVPPEERIAHVNNRVNAFVLTRDLLINDLMIKRCLQHPRPAGAVVIIDHPQFMVEDDHAFGLFL
jgi:hypothetical protein